MTIAQVTAYRDELFTTFTPAEQKECVLLVQKFQELLTAQANPDVGLAAASLFLLMARAALDESAALRSKDGTKGTNGTDGARKN